MRNESTSDGFFLATFEYPEHIKVLIFVVLLMIYAFAVLGNGLVAITIAVSQELHKPMHILLWNLSIVDIIGCTCSVPKQLHILVTGDTGISKAACVVQAFCVHSFASMEVLTLAVMAFDRYVAICTRLHYHSVVTNRRSVAVVVVIWTLTVIVLLALNALIIPMTFADDKKQIQGIFCDNTGIVVHATSDTRTNTSLGSALVVFYNGPSMCLIAFTYLRILTECRKRRSSEFRRKALHTFVTHFLALFMFFLSVFMVFLIGRFTKDDRSVQTRNTRSIVELAILVMPVANVLIYCVRMGELRKAMVKVFFPKFFASRNAKVSTDAAASTNAVVVAAATGQLTQA
ncbi:olfactory receptor 2A12-like [Lampetra planeri]